MVRGRNERNERGLPFYPPRALLPGDPSTSALNGRRFESAISRRARKLRRLDHSQAGLEKAAAGPGQPRRSQTRLSFPSVHRDSAAIDAEISREIGRVKWVSIRALMGVSSGNYYNKRFSRIFTTCGATWNCSPSPEYPRCLWHRYRSAK